MYHSNCWYFEKRFLHKIYKLKQLETYCPFKNIRKGKQLCDDIVLIVYWLVSLRQHVIFTLFDLNKKYLVNFCEVVPYRTLALGEFLGSPLDHFQVLMVKTPLNKFTELQYLKWKWPKLIFYGYWVGQSTPNFLIFKQALCWKSNLWGELQKHRNTWRNTWTILWYNLALNVSGCHGYRQVWGGDGWPRAGGEVQCRGLPDAGAPRHTGRQGTPPPDWLHALWGILDREEMVSIV